MAKLHIEDLVHITNRIPAGLRTAMSAPEWRSRIFLGGGFIRACIAGEEINDIDLFVGNAKTAEELANTLKMSGLVTKRTDTQNAITCLTDAKPIQIIHRWVFDKPEQVAESFDFTVCCAVVAYAETTSGAFEWTSYCDDLFYTDLASKRLRYRAPQRNEDAGDSMLRVVKYLTRGYRISPESLSGVIARLMKDVNFNEVMSQDETAVSGVVLGLLREVDPQQVIA